MEPRRVLTSEETYTKVGTPQVNRLPDGQAGEQ